MSQQTINVGAAPNDGTGTPLRTAFQYCNSNFSELYTATGPSGNNITVPGNATITGDLTVDTSTLKVDSANNYVGIGTAAPKNSLSVNGEMLIAKNNSLYWNAYYSSGFKSFASGYSTMLIADNSGNFTISNTASSAGSADASISFVERLKIDSSGNLGLGVTPSAWTSFKVLQVGNGLAIGSSGNANARMFANTYYDGSYKYVGTGTATQYEQDGYHRWYTAASGTAGGLINGTGIFTTALTLNTNGCLVLQGGALSATGVGIAFPATQAASSDANTLDDYEEGTWTPTVAAETGTIGSTSIISANYTKIGRLVSVTFDIRVITAGTGSGGLKVSLPFSPSLGGQTCGAGREYINTGYMLQISKYDATNVLVYFYNNTTMIADNNRVMAGYTYFI